MAARGLQALGTAPGGARKRAAGKQSRSETDINQAAALAREAKRMADIAAEFTMFGVGADELERSAWENGSDAPFRTSESEVPSPANDVQPRSKLPELPRGRIRLSPALPSAALRLLDWLFVLVVAELAARWSHGATLGALAFGDAALFVATAMWLKIGLWLTGSYRIGAGANRIDQSIGGLAIGAVGGLVCANLLAHDARAAAALAAILPASAFVIAGIHACVATFTAAAWRKGAFAETVVIVGATSTARTIAARLQKSGEAKVVAIVDDRRAQPRRRAVGVRVAGDLGDLLNWPSLPQVDRILIALPASAEARVRDLIERLRVTPNRLDVLLGHDIQPGWRSNELAGMATACVSGRPHCHRRAFVKRTQDILIGSVLLVVFAAPMLLFAAAIRLGGPVLFRQQRQGFNNAAFTLLKFRTMRPGTQEVTRIGAFLRRTGLDELPQLFNVLNGDMSLVGPRPHDLASAAAGRSFSDIVADYAHRHRVKPGITGLAQINGCRGAVRTPAALRRRLKLDLEYIERASLLLDAHILARTVGIVLADIRAAFSGT